MNMSNLTGNEPAMPFNYRENTPGFKGVAVGLTIRQHFAGLAMQGLLANATYDISELGYENYVAEDAVKISDALIEALNKTHQP